MYKSLTIAVAAYNVERYLEKLCESVAASGCLDDLEVLIVNDGSTDRTAELAECYCAKYPDSFFHIVKENGGHGSAINKGIELATGKYFKVLDGDDWVDPVGLALVVGKMRTAKADLVATAWKCVFEDTGKEEPEYLRGLESGRVYELEEACRSMGRLYFHGTFFRTALLKEHGIRIDEHRFYVDNEMLWFPFPYASTIVYYDQTVYCYRLGLADQSVNPEVVAKRIDQHDEVSRRVVDYYAKMRPGMSAVKAAYFDRVIADNISWHFEALLMLPFGREALRMIRDYRTYVKERAPLAVEKIRARAVRWLLASPAAAYPIAWKVKALKAARD